MEPQLPQHEIEAAVRRYLARVGRRYAPLVVGLVALLLVVLLVPTVNSKNGSNGRNVQASATGGGTGGNAGTDSTTGDAGTAATVASGGGTTGTGGGATGSAQAAGITPPAAAGSKGQARSGVNCGPGVRQVAWSGYAPACIPAYTGNNGGATSWGVSKDTVTAVFRRTNSAEEKAAFAAVGDAAPGTDDQYLSDFRTYVDFFNKNYELYGRKVLIKDYSGQGDNLEEDQGRNLAGAQADAATARNIGGFMDVSSSPTLASTQPYEENLAHEKVIAIGAVGLPKSWFRRYAPYEYSITPDGSDAVQAGIHAVCQRLAGMKAIFAGDAVYQKQNRVFGIIHPDNPEYSELANEFQSGIKSECGQDIKRSVSYSINIATMEQQSVNVIAQMHQAGVTTVLCVCDPVVEIFLSQAADQQKYFPEWFPTYWLDPQGRSVSQDQWSHAIAGTWPNFPPKAQNEAYRVFKMANPKAEPAEQYYVEAYWTTLYIFSVLQHAGPNLNPQTFKAGANAMNPSDVGMFGFWKGGPEAFSPLQTSQVSYWDPNATSNMDGKKGAWVPCEGGKWFNIHDQASFGPAHTQPHCFGK